AAGRGSARARPDRRGVGTARRKPPSPRRLRHEALWVAALLFAHLVLVLWGATRASVTFDENFHVPDGVIIAARGDFSASPITPPLLKALCGWAALAAGARLPSPESVATGDQALVGESFMRLNAARYQRIYVAARGVVLACSLALGALVWRFARRLYG